MPSSAKTGNANIAAATDKKSFFTVSYTHLTLPTILLV